MKPTARIRSFLVIASSSLLAISSASAASGTWDTDAAGNWTDIANWLGDAAYASGADSTATFGDFITVNRIITLNAAINIGNITASDITHNYTISGANILTLDRSSGIPTIDVTSGRTLTIGSEIAGLDGLQKIGLGTLTLTGANSYTGDTTITNSTLNLGGATATGSLASTVLNLAGGTLSYTRTGSATQNLTTTNIKLGASTATTVTGSTLNLGDLTRDVGGTLNFGSTAGIITSETNNGSGIIGGWATFNNQNWAVANGAGAITGSPTYYTTITGGTAGANYTNVRNMDVSGSVAMDATINPSTVRFNVAAASTVTLAAGDNIIASGGILVTSTVGNNASTITGGNLAGSSGGDLIIHQHNTNTLGALTISSIIKDNGTATGLTKSGAGTLVLSGDNTYTGITAINAGVVEIAHANALGTTAGNTTIAGTGQLKLLRSILNDANGITSPENITITGSGTAIFNNSQRSSTLSGDITLASPSGNITFSTANGGSFIVFSGTISQTGTSRDLIFNVPSSGGQGITINNAIANNGGRLLITAAGTSLLKGVNATDGTGIGETVISAAAGTVAQLKLGVSNAINTTANLTIGSTVGGTNAGKFDLASYNQTINALIGNGTEVTNSTRTVTNSVNGTSTLTVGSGGGTGTFNGLIVNTDASKIVALIKTGVGTQTLTGANTYTGGTRIDGGILNLGHATNTLADAGAVNVNGGTLALGTNTDTVGAVTLTSGSITGSGAGELTGTGSAYDVRSGTVSAKLGGSVGLTKTTAGTVTLSGGNTYSGATNVNNGRLTIDTSGSINASSGVTIAGGALRYNASTNLATTVTFTSGTLEGTNWNGNLSGLTIGSGQTISPGNSPGTATTGSQTWAGAGSYLFEINNATGATGADPGWDLLSGSGTLDITATSGSKFNILLTSLTLGNIAGDAANFSDATGYNWLLADFFNPITGYAADRFFVNTTAFDNTFTGTFGVVLGNTIGGGDNTQLYLTYTPIPEPRAVLLGGLGMLMLLRRRMA